MAEFRHTHRLLLKALNPAPEDAHYDRFHRIFRREPPLTQAEIDRWFSFDSFLELLGLAGINQEASGGLYALHAHLNHSCEPNVQVSSKFMTLITGAESAEII